MPGNSLPSGAALERQSSLGAAGKKLLSGAMKGAAAAVEDAPLPYSKGQKIRLGLAWDFYEGAPEVDLDCAALIIDAGGILVDACYYNNLECSGGGGSPSALVHSGDNRNGAGEGFDETIVVDLDALSSSVACVALVVNAYSGGSFTDVESARINVAALDGGGGGGREHTLVDDGVTGERGANHTSLIVALIYRSGSTGQWLYRRVQATGHAQSFVETFPSLKPHVDGVLPSGAREKHTLRNGKTFDMHKSVAVRIPPGLFIGGEDLYVGLGWETFGTRTGTVDLDASVIFSNGKGGVGPIVDSYRNLVGPGVRHLGDSRTGEGSGDDENILVDLDAVPFGVKELFVVVNIFSAHTFCHIHDAYVRLVSVADGCELLKYKLEPEACTGTGLVFCKIFRTLDYQWAVQGIGQNCRGARATDYMTLKACGLGASSEGIKQDGGVGRVLYMRLQGRNLPNKDGWFNKSDPYCVFKKRTELGFVEFARSAIEFDTLNPRWPDLRVAPLEAAGNLDAPLLTEVLDNDKGNEGGYMREVLIEGG